MQNIKIGHEEDMKIIKNEAFFEWLHWHSLSKCFARRSISRHICIQLRNIIQ